MLWRIRRGGKVLPVDGAQSRRQVHLVLRLVRFIYFYIRKDNGLGERTCDC